LNRGLAFVRRSWDSVVLGRPDFPVRILQDRRPIHLTHRILRVGLGLAQVGLFGIPDIHELVAPLTRLPFFAFLRSVPVAIPRFSARDERFVLSRPFDWNQR